MVVLLLGVEKERDDDVDANTALGSDGRHPLRATTFIVLLVLVLVFSSSGALCVYIYSEEYLSVFRDIFFFLVQKTQKGRETSLSLSIGFRVYPSYKYITPFFP